MAGSKSTYKNKLDYVLNMVGLMVGFSNIWRFPYVCYKNGGGAFIFAYLIYVCILVLPLVAIEGALGQYTGKSVITVWSIIPLFKGLGYSAPFMMVYWNSYLPVLMSWAVRWLGASLTSDPVWTRCNNSWNTEGCIPLFEEQDVDNYSNYEVTVQNQSLTKRSSVEEFFNNFILAKSDGLENYGTIKSDLLLSLAIVWVLAYFAVWKGIGWTSKVVYFTATAPIAMLLVLVVRGATLEGAGKGIKEYLKPDISKLGEFGVWSEAASQVLFSFGTCTGSVTTLSMFNKYKHNFLRDMIILLVSNAAVSFLAGFACFSVLGHMSYEKNVTIASVAEKGPGLVFVVYPAAMSLLPMYQLWCPLFFVMMLLIGFDSLFVYHEAFICCLRDRFPRLFRFRYSNEIWLAVTAFLLFLVGLTMITPGGIYVLQIFNTYSVTGWCLYFISLAEFIMIGWVFGSDDICDIMEDMLDYKLVKIRVFFKIIWKYIGPLSSVSFMIYFLALSRSLKYESYVYPTWINVLGWMTAFSSSLAIPITAVWVLYNAKGNTFREKLAVSLEKQDMRRPMEDNEKEKEAEKMLSSLSEEKA